jgi:hypothetical protein
VRWLKLQRLGHGGHDIRLADRLTAVDGQRLVGIGEFGVLTLDKTVTWDKFEGTQHAEVVNAAPAHRQQKLHPLFRERIVHLSPPFAV